MSKNINECIVCDDRLNYVNLIEQYDILKNKYDVLLKDNETYEQQLTEKEKQIERLKVYDDYRFELPYPKVKILGKTFEDIQELLDKWLKQGSKDKIEFAIDELEKVRELLFNAPYEFDSEEWCWVEEQIDNQIKELKKDMK